jgi:hypothetical protein
MFVLCTCANVLFMMVSLEMWLASCCDDKFCNVRLQVTEMSSNYANC